LVLSPANTDEHHRRADNVLCSQGQRQENGKERAYPWRGAGCCDLHNFVEYAGDNLELRFAIEYATAISLNFSFE